MSRIEEIEKIDIAGLALPPKKDWTAIIPAAGRGTRLGDARPKILYPLLGKPILEWLVQSLDPFVERFVFVLAPDARALVEPVLKSVLEGRYSIVIQSEPKGMADAVWQAKPRVRTENCIVLWGDQVTVARDTIAACVSLHASRKNSALTFPTVWRKAPYIHFERDAHQRLVHVYQAREALEAREEGENDCGIFFFNSQRLFDIIDTARAEQPTIGFKTGEFNLLPLLPRLDRYENDVVTLRIQRLEETQGVNTPEDARRVEDILKAREKT
jgi:bifunctional UDP-N-acetylglucosamine pyrophosphorylase/glucosamine-1-phosphate N-acetyltransferase